MEVEILVHEDEFFKIVVDDEKIQDTPQ